MCRRDQLAPGASPPQLFSQPATVAPSFRGRGRGARNEYSRAQWFIQIVLARLTHDTWHTWGRHAARGHCFTFFSFQLIYLFIAKNKENSFPFNSFIDIAFIWSSPTLSAKVVNCKVQYRLCHKNLTVVLLIVWMVLVDPGTRRVHTAQGPRVGI